MNKKNRRHYARKTYNFFDELINEVMRITPRLKAELRETIKQEKTDQNF